MSRRFRRTLQLAARGAFALPVFAYGHGGEFLEARLHAEDGVLQLNIVAEYGNNPMIADEAEARRVLADALRVIVGPSGPARRLEELSPVTLAPRSARDPKSPMPPSGHDSDHAHHLLGASWSWSAPEGDVSFLVPETCRQTVLFWIHSPDLSQPRWTMLVPGDRTPAIAVEHPWWRSPWATGGLLSATLAVGMFVVARRKRRRA